jgi:hypothetical protein
MSDEIEKNNEIEKMDAAEKRKFKEYHKLIELDLKSFLKKKAYPNVASCFRNPNLHQQIIAIKAFTSLYDDYPEEVDKLLDVMIRSFLTNQKFVAVTLLVNISFAHPEYAFPKMAKYTIQLKELVEIVSDALKIKWQDNQNELIEHFLKYWELRQYQNLKKTAIMSLNTQSIEETDAMLDFLGTFMHESEPFIHLQLALKVKELYVREPYFVEAKMREWISQVDPVHASQIVVQSFKEISKRQDPNLIDRSCIILENWSKNPASVIQETAAKVLAILKDKR